MKIFLFILTAIFVLAGIYLDAYTSGSDIGLHALGSICFLLAALCIIIIVKINKKK
jgi:hypothetical protein